MGLTVVAMGTSLPELVVSVRALQGIPAIAIGNVIGSNLFNIVGTPAIKALVVPLPVRGSVARIEWRFMFAASWIGEMFMRDGTVDGLEGLTFLAALVLFTAYAVWLRRQLRLLGSLHLGACEGGEPRGVAPVNLHGTKCVDWSVTGR